MFLLLPRCIHAILERFVLLSVAGETAQIPHTFGMSLGEVDGEEVDLVTVVVDERRQRATDHTGL